MILCRTIAQVVVEPVNVGKCTGHTVTIHLKPKSTPFYSKSEKNSHSYIPTINKEVAMLVELGGFNRFKTDS